MFDKDIAYFIDKIEYQIEENAKNAIDITKFYIRDGKCDIGVGYIRHTRFKEVILRLTEHFTNVGFEVYVFEDILEIKLPLKNVTDWKENEKE